MASYFDIAPAKADAPPAGDGHEEDFGRPSMLTPQVSRILDDFAEEHSSSSSSDEIELSEDSDPTDTKKVRHHSRDKHISHEHLKKSRTSPQPPKEKLAPPRPGWGGGASRHPHLARFHSLRSMLFSSHIEDAKAQMNEEQKRAEAEAKWTAEHEKRKGLNRPKTPESPNSSPEGSPTKPGFVHRMSHKLKRLSSKDSPPPMPTIVDDDKESTASNSDEDTDNEKLRKRRRKKAVDEDVSDAESLGPSQVDELVRWVSRRDPESDGERRGRSRPGETKSGRGSLGQSNVEDLVRFVSSKEERNDSGHHDPAEEAVDLNSIEDASTASDSEGDPNRRRSFGNDDVDDLVRWISRKEGDKAGPLRETKQQELSGLRNESTVPGTKASIAHEPTTQITRTSNSGDESDTHSDSDVDLSALDSDEHQDLVRWVTRKDETSGESDIGSAAPSDSEGTRPRKGYKKMDHGSLAHRDVDELVRWVSKRDKVPAVVDVEEEHRGRRDAGGHLPVAGHVDSRKDDPNAYVTEQSTAGHDETPRDKNGVQRGAIKNSDIPDLVRFASYKVSRPGVEEQRDDDIPQWKKQEDELGRAHGAGSLAPGDIDDLVQHVRSKDTYPKHEIPPVLTENLDGDHVGRTQDAKGSLQPE